MSSKKYDLYWFSGSGNTLDIAMCIYDTLIKNGKQAELIPIEKSRPEDINQDSVIGLIFPVAVQGTYPIVWDFVRGLPKVNGTECFMVDTLGMYSGGIVGPVKRIVKKKGFNPVLACEIIMPSNFSRKEIEPEKDKETIRKAKDKAERFTMMLIEGNKSWHDIPLFSRLMSLFSRSKRLWNMLRKSMPPQIDADKCIKCGLCVKLCPVGTLVMEDKNSIPTAKDNCMLCQRCKAFCPKNALKLNEKSDLYYRNENMTSTIFLEKLNN